VRGKRKEKTHHDSGSLSVFVFCFGFESVRERVRGEKER